MRTGSCPLCNHGEVVEGTPGEFGHYGTEVAAAFTYEPRWLMGGRNPEHAYGQLVYYMCRSCGYVQWFVQDPADVPIDAKYGTRLVTRKQDPPYR